MSYDCCELLSGVGSPEARLAEKTPQGFCASIVGLAKEEAHLRNQQPVKHHCSHAEVQAYILSVGFYKQHPR